MSLLIRQSLKRNKNSNCWEILVEYNVTELKSHLIKTLPEGYIWQDYLDGKIQIDHIIPIRTFKFQNSEDEEFKQCWALKNLRLLTIKENLNKGSKLIKS